MNDLIESERKAVETEEVTPTVINDDIEEEENSKTGDFYNLVLDQVQSNAYYDPEHTQLVIKYHKMEKGVAK